MLVMLATAAACAKPPEPADLVLLNGGIYTVDAERSWTRAAAALDGVIVAVGENAAIRRHVGPTTRVIDPGGRMAMPGLHDSHIHPLEGAYEQVYCNLWDADSAATVSRMLADCAAASEGDWLETILDAYTINGAWLFGHEDRLGSIETGKTTDIIILDRSLFMIAAEDISETQFDLTIFGGRIVYDRHDRASE